jgi:hypothetical protein
MIQNFHEFYSWYNLLAKKYNYSENWLGIVGKNYFENNITSKKVYFQIWNILEKKDYPFDGFYNIYTKYASFIDMAKCANNGFALKQNLLTNKYNFYFHLKLLNTFSFDTEDIVNCITLQKYDKAVSVEFSNSEIDIKRYYYIRDKEDINAFLSFLNIDENVDNIKYIEYTVSPQKGIFIYKDPKSAVKGIVKNTNKFIIEDILNQSKQLNTRPAFFGKYHNGKTAIYWDLNKNNNFYEKFVSC